MIGQFIRAGQSEALNARSFRFRPTKKNRINGYGLVGSFVPANQSAGHALVSLSFGEKQARTKGTNFKNEAVT